MQPKYIFPHVHRCSRFSHVSTSAVADIHLNNVVTCPLDQGRRPLLGHSTVNTRRNHLTESRCYAAAGMQYMTVVTVTRNNRRTVGGGVLCWVHAEAVKGEPTGALSSETGSLQAAQASDSCW
jgi:hypothetical protein